MSDKDGRKPRDVVFAVGEGDAIVVVVGVVQRGVPMDDRRRMFAVSRMHVLGGQHQCCGHSLREYERDDDAARGPPNHRQQIIAVRVDGVNCSLRPC